MKEVYNLPIIVMPNEGIQLIGDNRFFIYIFDTLYKTYLLDEDVEEEIREISAKHDFESTKLARIEHFVVIILDVFKWLSLSTRRR
ncbi:hypothetical protein [Salirhabdus salicampi]|uniref:hypothetical protein n=1 Tax=Salirhabdus salicampi TaxID=476102 RepID=UPI0020C3F1C9|nr:hypothetical protein [Salirhabdus salicampi]MCP8615678.1 hypothetical protein [Salirhabdus salicampi]